MWSQLEQFFLFFSEFWADHWVKLYISFKICNTYVSKPTSQKTEWIWTVITTTDYSVMKILSFDINHSCLFIMADDENKLTTWWSAGRATNLQTNGRAANSVLIVNTTFCCCESLRFLKTKLILLFVSPGSRFWQLFLRWSRILLIGASMPGFSSWK